MGRFLSLLVFFGINLVLLKKNIGGLFFYFRDLSLLKKQRGNDDSFVFGKKYPILSERFVAGGIMSGHYFHQDLFIAKEVFKENPIKHVDVGSRTDGFIAHLAVFRKVEVLDIRQLDSKVENVTFQKADLMKPAEGMVNYCDSISSLHAIEHFGLGRYGDPIDYFGHIKAIKNITSMLKKEGIFYFSVPIGKQRIEFNAHRVFSVKYLLGLFEEDYSLVSFSYVNDAGDFFENIELSDSDISANFGCSYGCGIFKFLKN